MYSPRVVQPQTPAEAQSLLEWCHCDLREMETVKEASRLLALENVGIREAGIIRREMEAVGGKVISAGGIARFAEERLRVLLIGTASQQSHLVERLKRGPRECGQIATEIEETLKGYERKEFILKLPSGELKIDRTLVMGILNVTPDSFSDGGMFERSEDAIRWGVEMAKQGADIVDVGGESTRPFSEPVPEKEELERVLPVIEALADEVSIPISVDTYKPTVAEKVLDAGACIINDVTGLRDKRMVQLLAERGVPAIIMHMLGDPKTMQLEPEYEDVVADIIRFLRERVDRAVEGGVEKDQLIVDPGIGFGKTVEHNLQILRRLSEFRSLGLPIMVGTSRKSFIGKILDLDVDKRLEGSLAAAVVAVMNGASIVRVHDVAETVRAVRLAEAIARAAR